MWEELKGATNSANSIFDDCQLATMNVRTYISKKWDKLLQIMDV